MFLFSNCAEGARLLYGTTGFLVALSTFLIGYRQIRLAHMIQSIVMSGDLVAEDMKKKSDQLFKILLVALSIYFVLYLCVTIIVKDPNIVTYLSISFNVINAIFTFGGLMLYFYTIMMLRNAINQCTSFKFDVGGTVVIFTLYLLILMLQIFYLLSYQIFDYSLIIVACLHFLSYFVTQVTCFIML